MHKFDILSASDKLEILLWTNIALDFYWGMSMDSCWQAFCGYMLVCIKQKKEKAMSKNVLSPDEDLARIKGNLLRLSDFWEKFSDGSGPVLAFIEHIKEVLDGKPLTFRFYNCSKCEEDGESNCPWYGEPDGCNNRSLRDFVLKNNGRVNVI